jgi:hypothetical protein
MEIRVVAGLEDEIIGAFRKRSPAERSNAAMLLRMMESWPERPPRESVANRRSWGTTVRAVRNTRGSSNAGMNSSA